MKTLEIDLNKLSDEGLKCYLCLKEEIGRNYLKTPKMPEAPKYEPDEERDELPESFDV